MFTSRGLTVTQHMHVIGKYLFPFCIVSLSYIDVYVYEHVLWPKSVEGKVGKMGPFPSKYKCVQLI